MSAYASAERVRVILDAETEPDPVLFAALNETASNELDAACRITGFGTEPEPSTLYFTATQGPVLVLDPPALSVETVTDYGSELDPAEYRLIWRDADRFYGLERPNGGGFAGEVAVTGTFADIPSGPVPAQIVEAASVLVAGYLRRDRMPAGEVSGPEGLTFRPSNPWSDERVKRAVDRYRVTPLVV